MKKVQDGSFLYYVSMQRPLYCMPDDSSEDAGNVFYQATAGRRRSAAMCENAH